MSEVERRLAAGLERGDEVVLATVIGVGGEPPSRPGAKVLLGRGGALAGTLGCSEFDAAATADVGAVLAGGRPVRRTYTHDLGTVEVFLEPHGAAPTLVVAAATPVAACLLPWAARVGLRTVLVETRPERRPGPEWTATAVVTDLEALPAVLGGEVYGVHTDHDSADVVDVVELLLRHGARLVGIMGSRRHTGHHLEDLRRRGLSDAELERVETPVGLDLGGRSAEEIALAIIAGVVAARHGAEPRRLADR